MGDNSGDILSGNLFREDGGITSMSTIESNARGRMIYKKKMK